MDKPKKYTLTQEEKVDLSGRKFLLTKLEYLSNLLAIGIEEDMSAYINNVVKKRLSIPFEQLVNVNIDKGELEIAEETAKENGK